MFSLYAWRETLCMALCPDEGCLLGRGRKIHNTGCIALRSIVINWDTECLETCKKNYSQKPTRIGVMKTETDCLPVFLFVCPCGDMGVHSLRFLDQGFVFAKVSPTPRRVHVKSTGP